MMPKDSGYFYCTFKFSLENCLFYKSVTSMYQMAEAVELSEDKFRVYFKLKKYDVQSVYRSKTSVGTRASNE